MKRKTLSRRALLQGAGGAAVALPFLELMSSTTKADGGAEPCRFLASYGGASIGSDRSTDTLTVPSTEGAGYEIRRALQPVADMGLRDEVMLVSGLKIPWGADPSSIPGGRAEATTHNRTFAPQLAGTHTTSGGNKPRDSTCDVLVADAIGEGTAHEALRYSLRGGSVSYRQRAGGGVDEQSYIGSPRFAYENLFTGVMPAEAEPEEEAYARFLARRRRSVLDLVRDNTQRLSRRLGGVDRIRMEQHFDAIRDLESRLETYESGSVSACTVPEHPGEDPSSNALDEKADLMTRMLALGFACDLSRSASLLQSTPLKSRIPMDLITDWDGQEMHYYTHGGEQEGLSDGVAWFIKQMCRMTAMLRDLPAAGGTSVLDHTAMVLTFEAGHGYDPDTQTNNAAHSTENMVALVFGRAGGLKHGHHIRAVDAHPAQVVLTTMQAAGYGSDQMGEVSGGLSVLRA